MVSFENIVWIVLYVDRNLHPLRLRHIYDKYIRAVVFSLHHVAVLQDVRAAYRPVVQPIPKIFLILLHLIFRKTINKKSSILLLNAKHDDSTLSIRKSGICLPQ